ncbi:hypothetical protein TNCV_730601 [Trichonephila clavipes]|nr:hypothetical protein TNCV_730601 [Trichonephila clavipes]
MFSVLGMFRRTEPNEDRNAFPPNVCRLRRPVAALGCETLPPPPRRREAVESAASSAAPHPTASERSLRDRGSIATAPKRRAEKVQQNSFGTHLLSGQGIGSWLALSSSSPVPLKTRRVGERCTLNLSRAQTSSVGVVSSRVAELCDVNIHSLIGYVFVTVVTLWLWSQTSDQLIAGSSPCATEGPPCTGARKSNDAQCPSNGCGSLRGGASSGVPIT